MNELRLTKSDSINYDALINAIYDINVKGGSKRQDFDRLNDNQKLKIAQKQDYCCLDCGEEFIIKNGKVMGSTVEHIIPFRYGSKASPNNVVLLCEGCNQKRSYEDPLKIIQDHYGKIDLEQIKALGKNQIHLKVLK